MKVQNIEHVSLLDIKNKKLLLCLTTGRDEWQLPGGKPENGETEEQTLIRECKEEICIDIKPDTIRHFETITGEINTKNGRMPVRIKIYTADFDGQIIPDNEIREAKYLSYDEIDHTSDMGWKYLKKLKTKGLID